MTQFIRCWGKEFRKVITVGTFYRYTYKHVIFHFHEQRTVISVRQIWTRNWGGRVLSGRIGYYQSVWAQKDRSWESCDSTKEGGGMRGASFWLCRMYKLCKTWCDLYPFHHLLFLSNYTRDQFGQIIWNVLYGIIGMVEGQEPGVIWCLDASLKRVGGDFDKKSGKKLSMRREGEGLYHWFDSIFFSLISTWVERAGLSHAGQGGWAVSTATRRIFVSHCVE